VPDVTIDFDKISQRILAMPLPARSYTGLQVAKAGTLLALESPAPGSGATGTTVHRYDLRQRRGDVLVSGVRFFEVSANGEKILTAQDNRWTIQNVRPLPPASGGPAATPPAAGGPAPTPPAAGGPGSFTLRTDDIEVRSDPTLEWKQMYHDAWRIQREFFYDPNLHGLDLQAAIKRYEPYLASVQSRRDLNYVFADMMGEITVGHLSVGGGDVPDVRTIATGLLGADYKIENGRYRFARVYDGENWNPDLRAPLTQPGVNVQEGEYLLSVNGRDVRASDNVYSFFKRPRQTSCSGSGRIPTGQFARTDRGPVASEARATSRGSKATAGRSTTPPAARSPTSTCPTRRSEDSRTSPAITTRKSARKR
jgi:tricorn protease